MLKLTVQ